MLLKNIWSYSAKFKIIIYLVTVIFLSRFFALSDLVKGFLGIPLFILVPLQVGSIFKIKDDDYWINKIFSWCAGVALITVLFYLNFFLHFKNNYFIFVVLIFLLILPIFLNKKIKKYTISKELLLVILASFLPLIIFTIFSPYPFFHDTDQFFHNKIVLQINLDNFNFGNLSQMYYLPIFHVLLALITKGLNFANNPLPLFWTARFIVYPLYALGVYIFTYEFSKNKTLAFFAALIAPWFTIEYSSLVNFAPKIISYVFAPFIFYFALKNKKLLFLSIVIAIAIHFLMGIFNVLALFIIVFSLFLYNKKEKAFYFFLSLSYFFALAVTIGQSFSRSRLDSIFSFLGDFYAKGHNVLGENIKLLEYFSGPVLLFTLLTFILYFRKKQISLLPCLLIFLSIFYLPIINTERILPSIIPIFAYIGGSMFVYIYELNKKKYLYKIIYILALLIFFSCLIYKPYTKINYFINKHLTEGYFSLITPYDWAAMQWIKENDKEGLAVFSDPTTARFVSGYSYRAQGDLNFSNLVNQTKPCLIVISGRTTLWLEKTKINEENENNTETIVNIPEIIKTKNPVPLLNKDKKFSLIYSNEGQIYVYRFSPKPKS